MTNKEHPKAKWLRAIAAGETVECLLGEEWVEMTFPASVHEFLTNKDQRNYRIKPRISIGNYEAIGPMQVEPGRGVRYFYLNAADANGVGSYSWDGDSIDRTMLAMGMCWLKREDAELAAKAISELLTGKVND